MLTAVDPTRVPTGGLILFRTAASIKLDHPHIFHLKQYPFFGIRSNYCMGGGRILVHIRIHALVVLSYAIIWKVILLEFLEFLWCGPGMWSTWVTSMSIVVLTIDSLCIRHLQGRCLPYDYNLHYWYMLAMYTYILCVGTLLLYVF